MLHTPPLTSNQMIVIDLLGADAWDAVITVFAGLSKEQVFTRLSEMNPSRDNMELMELIFREMPR
jgi:hypothetical protein